MKPEACQVEVFYTNEDDGLHVRCDPHEWEHVCRWDRADCDEKRVTLPTPEHLMAVTDDHYADVSRW